MFNVVTNSTNAGPQLKKLPFIVLAGLEPPRTPTGNSILNTFQNREAAEVQANKINEDHGIPCHVEEL